MKLVYHLASTAVPGGSVRVLYNKIRWFIEKGGYEIVVVTTDQKGAPPFFPFPSQVKCIDLGINYWDDYSRYPLSRLFITRKKMRLHRERLSTILSQEKPDITIAHYPTEAWIAGKIKDGSKKVMEFHTSKYHRLASGFRGTHKLVALFRTWQDKRRTKLFDRFIVLTQEDADQWGPMQHLRIIPNSVPKTDQKADVINSNIVIAAGRLVPLKGFDLLLNAWAMLPDELRSHWQLRIFGDGQLESSLKEQIVRLGIQSSAEIHSSSKDIFREYAKCAFLVLTSAYEGFGMVLIEAMAVGLPVISFDCKCGPRDIIDNGNNGLIVHHGDCHALSKAMSNLMKDDGLRLRMSLKAKITSESFSEDVIMKKWVRLFDELLGQ